MRKPNSIDVSIVDFSTNEKILKKIRKSVDN